MYDKIFTVFIVKLAPVSLIHKELCIKDTYVKLLNTVYNQPVSFVVSALIYLKK